MDKLLTLTDALIVVIGLGAAAAHAGGGKSGTIPSGVEQVGVPLDEHR